MLTSAGSAVTSERRLMRINGCKKLIRYIQEHIWKILEGSSHTHKLHENIGS